MSKYVSSLKKPPYFWIYVFLAPTIILYTLYTVWPVVGTFYFSLTDWRGFGGIGRFIGLDNYRALLQDSRFLNSLKVTFLFMLMVVPARVVLSLLVAVVLNWKKMPARNAYRSMIFVPVVTTGAIIGVVMSMMLDTQYGPINEILTTLGLLEFPIYFLGQADYALPTVAAIWLWKWLGVCLIYWLASLQSVPEELYDQAKIDGAGPLRSFRYITAPLLKPFALIITVITISDSMKVFDLVLTLTGGGPFYLTEVIEVFIYRWAFSASIPRLGYASAAATIFGLIFLAITVISVYGRSIAGKQGAVS